MALSKQKWLRIGGLQLGIAVDHRYASRVRRSLPYRYLVRPAINALKRRRSVGTLPRNGATTSNGAQGLSIPLTPEAAEVQDRIAGIDWYHVMDLPHGVVTPGRADHRRQVSHYGRPEDMTGMRALDVATFDGFWAFEMERRGAQVVAIDIGRWSQADIPSRWLEIMTPEQDRVTGAGFRIAKELLGSKVERCEMSVYDLDPDKVGTFDLVFMSDLLLHLRDPQLALDRLYGVTRKDGYAIVAEPYSPDLEGFGDRMLIQFAAYSQRIWAIPSSATIKTMLDLAGFAPVHELSRFRLEYDHPFPVRKVVLKAHPNKRD
ncbi:MAG: class I SAM-dependent methyltransferase [Dehalococcoidia bacterium]